MGTVVLFRPLAGPTLGSLLCSQELKRRREKTSKKYGSELSTSTEVSSWASTVAATWSAQECGGCQGAGLYMNQEQRAVVVATASSDGFWFSVANGRFGEPLMMSRPSPGSLREQVSTVKALVRGTLGDTDKLRYGKVRAQAYMEAAEGRVEPIVGRSTRKLVACAKESSMEAICRRRESRCSEGQGNFWATAAARWIGRPGTGAGTKTMECGELPPAVGVRGTREVQGKASLENNLTTSEVASSGECDPGVEPTKVLLTGVRGGVMRVAGPRVLQDWSEAEDNSGAETWSASEGESSSDVWLTSTDYSGLEACVLVE